MSDIYKKVYVTFETEAGMKARRTYSDAYFIVADGILTIYDKKDHVIAVYANGKWDYVE
jgi:hypothetical protein